MFEKDTIAAIATGMTESGIGIIRISGNEAIEIGDKIFRSPSGKKILTLVQSHRMYYGNIVESFNNKETVVDEAMIVVMKAPRSYTAEDTVEIQCHGGVLLMRKILEIVLRNGARLAEPGEFSKRAFLNGRMDLSEAEAVMDLIHAKNEVSLQSSIRQLKGSVSDKVKSLREKIIYEIAFIESALDDPEHISLDHYEEHLNNVLEEMLAELNRLLLSAKNGKIIKDGITTVIVGKPNAGKSSLLNRLIGEEKAIVTDIAGTTRDVLEEQINLNGITLNLIDTAGIRSTEDKVEKIGVEKAKKYADDADLIIYVVDSSVPLDENDKEIMRLIGKKKSIVLFNKSDLDTVVREEDIYPYFFDDHNNKIDTEEGKTLIGTAMKQKPLTIIKTSMKDETGMEEFENAVKEMFFQGEISFEHEIIITNIRHKELLENTLISLLEVKISLNNHMPEDFLSIDLMNAYASLGRIIGEEVDDDLMDEIFQKFCLGK